VDEAGGGEGGIVKTLWEILLAIALFVALAALLRFVEKRLGTRLKQGTARVLAVGLGAIEIFAFAYGTLYFLQDLVVFHPSHSPSSWEQMVARPEYEAIEFPAGKNTRHGILRRGAAEESPLVLFFYGNGNNASQVMQYMETAGAWTYFNDYHCLIMDYAGYGPNGGRPSAKNICEEALAAYDCALRLPGVTRVIVGGYSIGTGPAAYLAAHREPAGLFLLAPYANSFDLYNGVLPIFYGPLRLFVKHRFHSDRSARAVWVPALVVASQGDELIPYASSQKLSACFEESTLVTLHGASHNAVLFDRRTLESIKEYLGALARA